jgi:ribonuclease J
MKDELIFCPLGGSGEIGMNMNLYAYGKPGSQKWIIVDVGVTFADDSLPGIDLIYADPGFIVDKKDNLLGIVLTHAHEDHIGAITYVWKKLKCKIYATPFTAALVFEKFKEKKIDIIPFLKIVKLNGTINLDPFKIEFVTLTHSILEPNGLKINTQAGTIFHTGDWKVDPNPLVGKKVNEEKLKKIGDDGVMAMICDSTNVFSIGRAGSEADVRKNMLNVMSRQKKKILVTSFASNVARMETVFFCAEKIGRHISLVGRSMQRIYKAARKCGYLQNVIEPLDPRDTKKLARDKIVYLCTGSQGEPMGALNRISNFTHPDVFIEKDDTVIFSSKIIPGNVRKHYNVHNKLLKDGINVITEETEFVHVSGHPNREDLKDMYKWIKPKSIIPVHGEHRHMKEQINFAYEMKIPYPVEVENGDIVKIFPGDKPHVYDKAPSGRLCVDGEISIEEDSTFIKERKNIANNGYVDLTLIISNKGTLYSKPIVNVKGLPIFEKEEFIDGLEEEILKLTKTFSLKNTKQNQNLIDGLKKTCRKYAKEKTGKKPITNINVIRI